MHLETDYNVDFVLFISQEMYINLINGIDPSGISNECFHFILCGGKKSLLLIMLVHFYFF